MTQTKRHAMKGIEADNLLAVLATIGCLAALEADHPEWQARVSWDLNPLRAFLDVDCSVSAEDVASAVDAGCRKLGESVEFDRKDVKFTIDEFRNACQQATMAGKLSL